MTEPTTLVILGASGDLTTRLLLPGLASLIAGGEQGDLDLLDGLKVIGSGRSESSRKEWQDALREAFDQASASGPVAERIIDKADWYTTDSTSLDGWKGILELVEGGLIVYFALPPGVVAKVLDALAQLDLPERTVFALEKPFGTDAESARRLNEQLHKLVPEDRVHRVDHFLGHRAVLGLLALRFNNRLLEPVWNGDDIERVEITYDETLGLEGRAGYYDTTGALRDMLQSHLLQVLAVAACEPPASVTAGDFRDATAAVLRATTVWQGDPVLPGTDRPSRRARYTAGDVGDEHLPAYAEEEGVDPSRQTETLAEFVVEIDNARWAGVPFVLRSGKAIGHPVDAVVVHFKPVRHRPVGQVGEGTQEQVTLGFKPPSIGVRFTAEGGDLPFELEPGDLEGDLPKGPVTEYGEVLRGVLGNDPTLSVRADVAEECWRIVQPVLDSWAAGEVPLDEYPAGSQGPSSWS